MKAIQITFSAPILSLLLAAASPAGAQAVDRRALTLGETQLVEIDASGRETPVPLSSRALPSAGNLRDEELADRLGGTASLARPEADRKDAGDDTAGTLGKIINVGEKVWKIVEAGRPVVNVDGKSATALPAGIADWQTMVGWQEPQVRTYRYSAKNLYGVTVIDFVYRILYIAGGRNGGRGLYLARLAVIPEKVDVAWGYRFDAEAEVPSVLNVGTADEPVAGAEVLVKWKVGTVLQSRQNSRSYYVRGDGQFKAL